MIRNWRSSPAAISFYKGLVLYIQSQKVICELARGLVMAILLAEHEELVRMFQDLQRAVSLYPGQKSHYLLAEHEELARI